MATTKSRRLSRALRWRRLTIPLAVMLLAAASHAEPALVHVEHENAAFHVQAAATLAADPKTVWRTLVDYDDLPSFIPDMTSSKTLRRAGETAVVEQRGRVGIGPFHRAFDVTLSVQEQPMNSVAAKALAGDFDRFESELSHSRDRRRWHSNQLRRDDRAHLEHPVGAGNACDGACHSSPVRGAPGRDHTEVGSRGGDAGIGRVGRAAPSTRHSQASSSRTCIRSLQTLAGSRLSGDAVLLTSTANARGWKAPVVQRVSDALQKALDDPGVRAKLEANGAAVVASKSKDYAQSLESEMALTEKMMKATNVTAQ